MSLNHPATRQAETQLEPDNWRPLREVIASLKAEVGEAIALRDEAVAAAAHADLIDAEHELRLRETVRRLADREVAE